jgi:hypothetical protein
MHGARLQPRCPARVRVVLAALVGGLLMSGCRHLAPPVKPWQRGHLVRRAMQFDDGLEGRFRQHMFSSREGAEGGYGHVGGGCGCN